MCSGAAAGHTKNATVRHLVPLSNSSHLWLSSVEHFLWCSKSPKWAVALLMLDNVDGFGRSQASRPGLTYWISKASSPSSSAAQSSSEHPLAKVHTHTHTHIHTTTLFYDPKFWAFLQGRLLCEEEERAPIRGIYQWKSLQPVQSTLNCKSYYTTTTTTTTEIQSLCKRI